MTEKVSNKDLMEKLEYLAFSLDDAPEYFKKYFGDSLGEHLIGKWKQYNREVIRLYNSLDTDNKEIFIDLIKSLPRFNNMKETHEFEAKWAKETEQRQKSKERLKA